MPDFLGIGAQKAGTAWLHQNLQHHPDFYFPPDIKEIRFFTGRTPKRLQPNSGSTINDMLGPDGYSSVSLFGAGEAEQLGREPLDEL